MQSQNIMDDEESMEIQHSEEEGNVNPNETPSGETSEAGEGAETPKEEEQSSEEELFELPDGRKVDAATLQKEWKENFAPEFTRRSQELAELKKGTQEPLPTEDNPYADPDYVPESYEEILKVAEQRALQAIESRQAQELKMQQEAEQAVIKQLEEVKKIDPSIDENKLFLHANKYGFRDLSQAYQNMRDMNAVVKTTQKNTANNIAKRNDPVSINPSGSVSEGRDPTMFETATDYLRSLKN